MTVERLFGLFTLFFFLSACGSADTGQDKAGETDNLSTIAFANTVSLEKLSDAGVRPIEIVVESNGISSGYTLSPDETIEDAEVSFRERHLKFLNEARATLQEEFDGIPNSEDGLSLRQMNMRLQAQLAASQDDFISTGFHVARVRVWESDADSIIREFGGARIVLGETQNPSPAMPGLKPQSTSHESWAPYQGTCKVNQGMTFQTFWFNIAGQFAQNATYEHETQVYDKNYANYDNYWSSNLPTAYYDTPFLDSIDNFTVGSASAYNIATFTQYYAHMSLRAGTASSATVRIKGQKGHRTPSSCYSTWCIFADATSGSLTTFTAPSPSAGISWQY